MMAWSVDCPGPVDESNFFEWECYISGPEGTPFEGGIFPATLTFPKVGIPIPMIYIPDRWFRVRVLIVGLPVESTHHEIHM
jgi:ubiquitin-protein ligase